MLNKGELMRIISITLIVLCTLVTTGLFSVVQKPLSLSAPDYIKEEQHRVNLYEGALQQAQSIYMRLSQRNTLDQYIKMLNDIVDIMNMAHAPRQKLQLADPKTVTPEQQTTIDQLTKREEDALHLSEACSRWND